MNYLSIKNSPEANLHIIAQSDKLVTQNFDKLAQNKKSLALKGLISIAATVAVVAAGIILGILIAPYAGIVAAIAIIPLAAWLYFKNKEKGNQKTLDNELKALDTIYSKMIDSLIARHNYYKYFVAQPTSLRLHQEDSFKMDMDLALETNKGLTQDEIQKKLDKIFEMHMKKIEVEISTESFYPPQFIKPYHLRLKESSADLKTDIHQLRENARKIAHSKSKNKIEGIAIKLDLLKKACQTYSAPYGEQFHYHKHNGLILPRFEYSVII